MQRFGESPALGWSGGWVTDPLRIRLTGMGLERLPASAAWRHLDSKSGFEVLFAEEIDGGWRFAGTVAAVEEGEAWNVGYEIEVDAEWRTRRAAIHGRSAAGATAIEVSADGSGSWWVDGQPVPEAEGCLDLDLEASAFTNAFPARRLDLAVGESAEAPAAYVRATGLGVARLEQRYTRLPDHDSGTRYDYESPGDDFRCEIAYDRAGLVLDYPEIAVREL